MDYIFLFHVRWTSESYRIEQRKNILLTPRKLEVNSLYISRKKQESIFNKINGTLSERRYAIVVGPKGCGKSTPLEHITDGKKGIVTVKNDGKTTLSTMDHGLLEGIGIGIEDWNKNRAKKVFGEICDSIQVVSEGGFHTWVPTVIFEVDDSATKKVIRELHKDGKQLTCDGRQAKCIIVLNDFNAAISMASVHGSTTSGFQTSPLKKRMTI